MTIKSKKIERIFKGVANHRRIDILLLVSKYPDITLNGIAEMLDCNIKTICEHVKRLHSAGLINKRYLKTSVCHWLSPYGEKMVKIIEDFYN